MQNQAFGAFRIIPEELFSLIIQKLNIHDIGILVRVSHELWTFCSKRTWNCAFLSNSKKPSTSDLEFIFKNRIPSQVPLLVTSDFFLHRKDLKLKIDMIILEDVSSDISALDKSLEILQKISLEWVSSVVIRCPRLKDSWKKKDYPMNRLLESIFKHKLEHLNSSKLENIFFDFDSPNYLENLTMKELQLHSCEADIDRSSRLPPYIHFDLVEVLYIEHRRGDIKLFLSPMCPKLKKVVIHCDDSDRSDPIFKGERVTKFFIWVDLTKSEFIEHL